MSQTRDDYLLRDSIFELLSDEEVARVSTAETARYLEEGDDYLDLEQLEKGVRQADGLIVLMENVLPKKAVDEKTWSQILLLLRPEVATRVTRQAKGATPRRLHKN